jgi:hypothetical protein
VDGTLAHVAALIVLALVLLALGMPLIVFAILEHESTVIDLTHCPFWL